MSGELYTVARAAERLHLHPKTVLRFIRERRLRATRIGKSYRIMARDLDAFAGDKSRPSRTEDRARATIVVDLPNVGAELQRRLTTSLHAAIVSKSARPNPIHLDTAYDPERRQLKVVIVAELADATALMQTLRALTAAMS
jgi:excisionase family DNA binding protein